MNNDANLKMDDDVEILRQRLVWLVGLRWYGTAAVIIFALIGNLLLDLHLPIGILVLIAAGMAAYNFYYLKQIQNQKIHRKTALQQIILDTLALTLVLFFSGGFLNPFFTFYFFIIILGAILLSPKENIFIIALVTVCFALQGLSSRLVKVNLELGDEGLLDLGNIPFHVLGAPISFVATALITAYFTQVIMGDLRKREREVWVARQQAELELSKLDNLLDRVDAGMLVFDRMGQVERVNDRLVSWFGHEGQNGHNACYLIGRFGKTISETSHDRELESRHYFETRLPTITDGVRDFEVMVSPIRDATGALIQRIELILDVTEQKKSQAQWAQAQKLAAIGQLAAGVAHEINTPLGTINILTEEAKNIVDEFPEIGNKKPANDLKDSLETIHSQVRRCKEITQGLLNFSRKSEHEYEKININDLVRRAIDLARHRMSGVELTEKLEPDIPFIHTDVHAVERVLFNVLLNAADAVESHAVKPEIHVYTEKRENELAIHVKDNGVGIKSDLLPHVTEPFYTTKSVGKGTGLGLYIAYSTIRDLGGRLEIESEPGEGTAVSIWLPYE